MEGGRHDMPGFIKQITIPPIITDYQRIKFKNQMYLLEIFLFYPVLEGVELNVK